MNRHSVAAGRAAGVKTDSGKPDTGKPDSGKRARILDAAVKVFAQKGFHNAKVAEIARAAGVADGTIYLYFKSKEELLLQLFEDRMEMVNERLRVALRDGKSPAQQLRALIRTHFDLVEREPELTEVLTVELRQSSKFMKDYKHSKFGEFLKLLAVPIEAGQRDGSFRADVDPPLVARALFGAMDDLALSWALRKSARARSKSAQQPAQAADQLASVFLGGLDQRGAPSRQT